MELAGGIVASATSTPVAGSSATELAQAVVSTPTDVKMEEVDHIVPAPLARSSSRTSKHAVKDALAEKRYELLSSGPESRTLVVKRYYALLLPTLIDVYSASVDNQVRTKAVLALMKIINFCDSETLSSTLKVSWINSSE